MGGLILVFLFTIAFPLLFFSLVPATFRIFLEFAEDSAEEQVSEATNMVSLGVNEQTETIQNKYTTLAVEIQNLIDDLPSENLPQLEAEIETLSNKLADTYMLSETTLEQLQAETALLIQSRRSEELAKVTKARNQAISGLADGIVADLSFLALWGVIIGPTTLITVLIAMSSVKSFVHRTDRELPPPISHNVAGMTRLVAWEAKQALEAKQTFIVDNDGNTRHIQWMSVNRNENGGIDLIGLFRDLPEFDMYGRPSSQTVRAQRHTIKTDLWGRVVKAEITDVMVPLPAGAPYYVPPTEKKRIAHDALHIRRP